MQKPVFLFSCKKVSNVLTFSLQSPLVLCLPDQICSSEPGTNGRQQAGTWVLATTTTHLITDHTTNRSATQCT